jgi:hypothetical protein
MEADVEVCLDGTTGEDEICASESWAADLLSVRRK